MSEKNDGFSEEKIFPPIFYLPCCRLCEVLTLRWYVQWRNLVLCYKLKDMLLIMPPWNKKCLPAAALTLLPFSSDCQCHQESIATAKICSLCKTFHSSKMAWSKLFLMLIKHCYYLHVLLLLFFTSSLTSHYTPDLILIWQPLQTTA